MVIRFRAAIAAALLAGLTCAPLAQAQDWRHQGGRRGGGHHGYEHRGGGGAGAAIIGGLIGLGIGAAISSSRPPAAYYGYPYGYYSPPPPPVYYGYPGY
ncbi:MAG TPA: hypothetical protein VND87_07345 [Stellaceae bacterium]|nr:hypothetical protein [Stellaceae bacterium]